MTPTRRSILTAGMVLALAAPALAQTATPPAEAPRAIIVSSTTSTQDSGLFGYILPIFRAKTGIEVKVVAQGTGQALDSARRGDADVAFVHARAQELKFVEEGAGVERKPVMYNDFVLIGPKADPAGIKGSKDIAAALKAIADKQAPFVSRGDRSGTHSAELALWKTAGIDLEKAKGVPDNAQKLARLIAAQQGVFIATPEYNHSLPPLLKNTIDWTSRPKLAA